MTYGVFMLIVSYVLAHSTAVKTVLHVRDLETLLSVCSTESNDTIIDINHIFSEYKKRSHLQVSTDTLYTYFRGLGVRFTGEYF